MKFQKFVKALGSDGIVYNRKNGERWLASDKVFMKIPEDIRSVTCTEFLCRGRRSTWSDFPDRLRGIRRTLCILTLSLPV